MYCNYNIFNIVSPKWLSSIILLWKLNWNSCHAISEIFPILILPVSVLHLGSERPPSGKRLSSLCPGPRTEFLPDLSRLVQLSVTESTLSAVKHCITRHHYHKASVPIYFRVYPKPFALQKCSQHADRKRYTCYWLAFVYMKKTSGIFTVLHIVPEAVSQNIMLENHCSEYSTHFKEKYIKNCMLNFLAHPPDCSCHVLYMTYNKYLSNSAYNIEYLYTRLYIIKYNY